MRQALSAAQHRLRRICELAWPSLRANRRRTSPLPSDVVDLALRRVQGSPAENARFANRTEFLASKRK